MLILKGSFINDSPHGMVYTTLTVALQAEGNACLLCEENPQLNTWCHVQQIENHI